MPPVVIGTKWFFEDALSSLEMLEPEWRELALSARYQSDSLTEEKIMTAWLEMRSLYERMARAHADEELKVANESSTRPVGYHNS